MGAYGLIGYGITKRLEGDGHRVTGLGRNSATAHRVLPGLPWITRDVGALCDVPGWDDVLDGISVVVNCAGALQDGPEDDLEAVHHHAVAALASACAARDIALIQISAVGAEPDASTAFMSSKARGDEAVRSSGAKFHIFRPGLVLAANAYGGTTMLRMLAAFPMIQPIAAPDAIVQTVSLDDVARAVAAAVEGEIPYGFEGDLIEPDTHTLRELVAAVRHWLGFAPARLDLPLPAFGVALVSKLADTLSHLGWRSPLRTTALKVLTDGVRGEPADLAPFNLPPTNTLQQTLSSMPVGAQDRLSARMALLFPVIIFTLSAFWIASGIIGIARAQDAALVLEAVGWPTGLAITSVIFWGLVDIAIGVAFAFRKYAYHACWAAVGVSLIYLGASTIFTPHLWADPLGPLVKIVPTILLAIVARAALDTR